MAEPSPARPPVVDTVDTHDTHATGVAGSAADAAGHHDPGETGQPAGLDDAQLYSALEAVLMVAAAPVQLEEFARVTGEPVHRVRSALEHLKADYDGVIGNTPAHSPRDGTAGYDGRSASRDDAVPAARVRGFELREVAGGWRIYSRSEHAQLVTDFVVEGSSSRLSQAALETLAVVAYLQPVSRSRVSAIRGVNVDGVVRTLVQRGLLTAHEREEATGSVLYSTTPLFLEKLGLGSLDELPDIAPLLPGTDQLDDVED